MKTDACPLSWTRLFFSLTCVLRFGSAQIPESLYKNLCAICKMSTPFLLKRELCIPSLSKTRGCVWVVILHSVIFTFLLYLSLPPLLQPPLLWRMTKFLNVNIVRNLYAFRKGKEWTFSQHLLGSHTPTDSVFTANWDPHWDGFQMTTVSPPLWDSHLASSQAPSFL